MKANKPKKPRRLLKRKDIIRIEKGHTIYAPIEARFAYVNMPRSRKIYHSDVTVGELMPLASSYFYESKKGSVLDTSVFAGDYVVVNCGYNGGGGRLCDEFHDGWHIVAEKLDDPTIEIEFYQTGSFTAVIEPGTIFILN